MKDFDFEKEIRFIARFYKKGLFEVNASWKKIRPRQNKWWSIPRIAAASSVIIVLSAAAGIWINNTFLKSDNKTEVSVPSQPVPLAPPLESVSRVIDFEDAPLPVVVDQIELVYGVQIKNLPANSEDYHLTLHYEGNVADLIETINEIFCLNLEIEK